MAKPKARMPKKHYGENPEFMASAFALFCEGMSVAGVAEQLRAEWPEVNERTLQGIAQRNEWAEQRAEYLRVAQKATAETGGLKAQVILELMQIRKVLRARVTKLNFAEIQQYRGVIDDLLYLTGDHPKLKEAPPLAVSSDAEVQVFLEVLQADEVVGPLLKKRRAKIEREWRKKLEAEEHEAKARTSPCAGAPAKRPQKRKAGTRADSGGDGSRAGRPCHNKARRTR